MKVAERRTIIAEANGFKAIIEIDDGETTIRLIDITARDGARTRRISATPAHMQMDLTPARLAALEQAIQQFRGLIPRPSRLEAVLKTLD